MKSRSTSHAKITRKTIESLDKQIVSLKEKRDKTIARLQARCKHPAKQIVEAPYRNSIDGYTVLDRPFRVCMLCGYAEEGWGCGYWKLYTNTTVLEINRESAWRDYVLKFYNQEELNKVRYHK